MSKGLLHFHSDFSYDGHNSIEEIAEWAKLEGIDFIILTEHDNDYDTDKFDAYVKECLKNSNDITIVPGIEYSFGLKRHIHFNVFGVNEFIQTNNSIDDIPRFLKYVKNKGGLSILNHPKSITKEIENVDFSALFGVELWNTKSDFLYSPDPRTDKFIKSKLADKAVFVTSDIHKIPKCEYAKILSDESIENTKSVIDLIRERKFYCMFEEKKIENHYGEIQLDKVKLFLAGAHQKTYKFLRNMKRTFGVNVSPKIVKMIKLK
jgi:hypothetical protein